MDTGLYDEIQKNLGTLEVKNDEGEYEEVGKVTNMNIAIIDDMVGFTKVYCTIFNRKKNRAIAGREFIFKGVLKEAEIEERIASYYISEGVVGKLQKEVRQYFDDICDGKIKHEQEDMHFIFNMLHNNFRFLIT